MDVNLLSDIAWQSKVDHATKVADFRSYFEGRDYGVGLARLVVCLMCQDPALSLKQRVRHVKANNTLYVDVMLDLPHFVQASHVERRRRIADEIKAQIRVVFEKRRIRDFNVDQFIADFDQILDDQFNGDLSTRFDQNCLERASGY